MISERNLKMEESFSTSTKERDHSFSFADQIFDFDPISPSVSQVCLPQHDMDTKWRSIAAAHPKNDTSKIAHIDRFDQSNTRKNDDYHVLIEEVKVPEEPFLLFLTHFVTCVPLTNVKEFIEMAFNKFPEISFEFIPGKFKWNALYVCGSCHCKMQFYIYSRGVDHIIEGNRLSGDCNTFWKVFSEMKSTILATYLEAKLFDSFDFNFPISESDLLTDLEYQNALKPILEMAKSGLMESELEASRLICDLSLHSDMQQLLCDSGCLQATVENLLLSKNSRLSQQHALLALANLSEAQSCQGAIIDSGVLPALLILATNGPYDTAEMSRESARILANLSSRMAARVVDVLGSLAVSNWISSVDSLKDERLRLHASRAKEFLFLGLDQEFPVATV